QRVAIAVSTRLVAERGRVDVVPAQHLRRAHRESDPGCERASGAVGIDRLNLILGLAGAVVVAAADTDDGLAFHCGGRPGDTDARSEVRLLRVIPRRGVGQVATGRGSAAGQFAGVRVEQHEQIAVFVNHAVVFVAHTIVDGQIRFYLPFVLRVEDQ